MKIQMKSVISGILLSVLCGGFAANSAHAEERRHRRVEHPMEWNRGRWVHDRHDGRLGWWWVVGSAWHFYTRPYVIVERPSPSRTVVVEQAPPPVVIQQAPPAQPPVTVVQAQQPVSPSSEPVIYYCKATGTNYPETMTCPGGWSTMTAQTPPQP